MMKRLRRQHPFLESILNQSNRFKRQEMLQHANTDHSNAVIEMVLNLLKKRIPVKPSTIHKLSKKGVLRELATRKNSLKRRRQHLLQQQGSGFWNGLKECYGACR